uniref:Putative salivary kunitz domain protein n=1 Tax=Ixodes ricinus TaxID=34613 RepID=A0A147BX38_IXORI
MKLLLIAVVISVHTTGLWTTTEAACQPRYNGGRGVPTGGNVQPNWTFNPVTSHCEQVMAKGPCLLSNNCFPTKDECEDHCDPETQRMKEELGQA